MSHGEHMRTKRKQSGTEAKTDDLFETPNLSRACGISCNSQMKIRYNPQTPARTFPRPNPSALPAGQSNSTVVIRLTDPQQVRYGRRVRSSHWQVWHDVNHSWRTWTKDQMITDFFAGNVTVRQCFDPVCEWSKPIRIFKHFNNQKKMMA